METGITAKDIMEKEVPAVSQNDQLARVRNIMLRRKTNKLLVHDDELKGIITEKDVARTLTEERRPIDEVRVREIMTRSLITSKPSKKPEELAEIMINNKISGIPIIQGEKLLGMVTKKNLVQYCSDYYRGLTKVEDQMTKEVKTMKELQSLFHAEKEMREKGISRIVITKEEKPVGIVTERNISLATRGLKPNKITYKSTDEEGNIHKRQRILPMIVGDVMQTDLKTINKKSDAAKAGERMIQEGVGSLIVEEKGKLAGIITKTDLVNFLAENK